MIDLEFAVVAITPDRFAASPQLLVRLRAQERTGARVHAMALRAQLMIEPQRRPYADEESATLVELFGGRDRWKDTLRPFLWTTTSTVTRGFTDTLEFDLPVACSYDVEVSAGKYLQGLDGGEVPVRLLFSGTVFIRGETGFSVEQVPWDLEATYRLPVGVWRELMDQFFPNQGWIRLDREVIDALLRYRGAQGLTGWDDVMGSLLGLPRVLP
jgi:Family of unknown function (DUF6084)